MKVMTVLGTRPEIIRLSRVIPLLDDNVDHVLVHTGQNSDPALSDVFFDDLELRKPDVFLGIDTSSLGRALGDILVRTEEVLLAERPDALLVLGDTNSCLSAVMAKRMRVPVYHMEAGNRCFDENVPEETNRRLVDHVADVNLVYTEHARRNLLAEGLHPRWVAVTGSPLREVLEHHRARIEACPVVERLGLRDGGFLLASIHRAETVDRPDRLRAVLAQLEQTGADLELPVVMSLHPRTANRPETQEFLRTASWLRPYEPFGFLDYNRLQLGARCVVSDSGSVSEESAILGFPAVTLRDSIERPEALESAAITLTPVLGGGLGAAVAQAIALAGSREVPAAYEVRNCSARVLTTITATIGALTSGVRR